MKSFRKEWGLTQEELAALLDITRGMLAMYESGRRQLPIAASEKLATLYQLLQQPVGKSMPAASVQRRQDTQLAKAEKLLKARARKAALEAAHAASVLDKMQQRYRQLQQKMILIQTLLPATPQATLQQSALQYMQARLTHEMERCAPARQALMACKMEACTALEEAALNACELVKC